jgi:hypothetical protein
MVRLTLGAFLAVALAQPAGPSARRWTQPKTAWGDPDLEGVWTSDNNFSIPLERPAEVADKVFLDGTDLDAALARRARTIAAVESGGEVGAGPSHWYENLSARSSRSSLIIDPPNGRLPTFTPAARQRAEAAQASRSSSGLADSWADRSLWDRCITVGLPFVMFPTGYNNNVRIIRSPGYVVITHEMIHDARVVPMNGSPHLSPAIRQYMGDRGAAGRATRWSSTSRIFTRPSRRITRRRASADTARRCTSSSDTLGPRETRCATK